MGDQTRLELTGSEKFSTREVAGVVVDARYWVNARQIAASGLVDRVFRLRAMTDAALREWDFEQRVQVRPGERDTYPMPVPEANLGSEPLDEYIERVYLDTAEPGAINDIRQFLEPVDETDLPPPIPMYREAHGPDATGV